MQFFAFVIDEAEDANEFRADVFHCLATGKYLDGKPIRLPAGSEMLPKLKSIELRYHQISFMQLLGFCSSRLDMLEGVTLMNTVDRNVGAVHVDVDGQIIAALPGTPSLWAYVNEDTTYTGNGRADLTEY